MFTISVNFRTELKIIVPWASYFIAQPEGVFFWSEFSFRRYFKIDPKKSKLSLANYWCRILFSYFGGSGSGWGRGSLWESVGHLWRGCLGRRGEVQGIFGGMGGGGVRDSESSPSQLLQVTMRTHPRAISIGTCGMARILQSFSEKILFVQSWTVGKWIVK